MLFPVAVLLVADFDLIANVPALDFAVDDFGLADLGLVDLDLVDLGLADLGLTDFGFIDLDLGAFADFGFAFIELPAVLLFTLLLLTAKLDGVMELLDFDV